MDVCSQLHDPAALPPGKKVGTHWIGGWVDRWAGLDFLVKNKKSCPYWDSNTGTSIQ